MRVDKRWSTFEYCWRFGIRPLMWLVRLALIASAVAVISLLLGYMSTLGLACFIALYGIWEIGRSIRSISHLTVNVARGEKLIVQRGAVVSVPKQDIDRLLETLARQEPPAA